MKCDARTVEALALGGAVLGGGGGGALKSGLELGKLALELGEPTVRPLEVLDPEATVITVSAVGAPAAKDKWVKVVDYVDSVRMLESVLSSPVEGMITNEMGGMASLNGLVQSALLGIPVVDAPCNGRAQPTSAMGSMGLDQVAGYLAWQAACGGNPAASRRIRLVIQGTVDHCSRLIRQASVEAGGLVIVARNPVHANYLNDHAAVGAMRQTAALGEALLEAQAAGAPADQAAADFLGGELVARGQVTQIEIETTGGFDVGTVWVDDKHELVFWNEYMLLEVGGERLYTFPDLMTTFDLRRNEPVSTADIRQGMEISVLAVGRERLILGSGMRQAGLFKQAEEAIGRPLVPYVFEEGQC